MSASTQLIADMTTVITNGPNGATLAKAIAPAGEIMDYPGLTNLALLKLKEADVQLIQMLTVTDASDGSKANIVAIQHALAGLSAPNGTLLTTIKLVITTGPTAATLALAIASAGPIMDYVGNTRLVLRKLEEVAVQITALLLNTDTSDATNKTLLTNIGLALV